MSKENNTIIGRLKSSFSRTPKSDVAQAIESLHNAKNHLAAYAAERSARQLSTTVIKQIEKDIDEIKRRLSGYGKS